jgi:hypothetical protein
MLPQSQREALVTLRDGRVLEGRIIRRTDHLEINGDYEHEIGA